MSNTKVPFEPANVKKCVCGGCPVQEKSDCVKELTDNEKEILKKTEFDEDDSKKLPYSYCSSGHATCPDLDWNKSCLCSSCAVWEKYNLAKAQPQLHFCRDGQAR